MQRQQYWPACVAGNHRSYRRARVRNATGRSRPQACGRRPGDSRAVQSANPGAAGTGARGALRLAGPIRWVAGVSRKRAPDALAFLVARSVRLQAEKIKNNGANAGLVVQSIMELAVIDSNASVVEVLKNISVALSEPDAGVIVALSCMDGLRRNNVVTGDHDDE